VENCNKYSTFWKRLSAGLPVFIALYLGSSSKGSLKDLQPTYYYFYWLWTVHCSGLKIILKDRILWTCDTIPSAEDQPLPLQNNLTRHRNTRIYIHNPSWLRTRDSNSQVVQNICALEHAVVLIGSQKYLLLKILLIKNVVLRMWCDVIW
jgi:hypothetical protein